MNLEYVGAEANFTVLAGVSPEYELEFTRDGQPLPVSGVTFDGVLVDADGDRQELVIHHAGLEENVLRVTFPHAEKVGRFDYEIAYTTQEGARCRLAYGVLQVLSTELLLEETSGLEFDSRRLQVRLPGAAGGHVQLVWRAGMEIMRAVEEARAAAEKLAGVDETLAQLDAQVEEFRVFVAKWKDDLPSVLVMNPVTGTIWVGGVDTGQPYRGQDGKAPRVNAYGNWETYNGQEWRDIGVRAFGRDGVDGDSMRHIMLDSEDDLPASAERGVVYITPKPDGGNNMWIWVENLGWLNSRTDTYGYATANTIGMVKLATDYPVTDGAPVGFNGQKQAMVPLASSTVPGALRPSSPEVNDVGGGTHMSVSGSLLVDLATVGRFGAVRVSTSEVLTAGGLIGLNADGQLLVRLATPDLPGAVLPGSRYLQLTRRPYLLAVGVDGQGRLANCLVGNGALQHKLKKEWLALKGRGFMMWMNDADFLVDDAHYLGMVTSGQFGQDEEEGLTLLPATADRLAGVYLVTAPAEATSPAQTVLPLSVTETRYAHAEAVYDRETCDERFMSTKGGVMAVKLCKVGVDLPPANEQEKGMLYIGV